MSRHPITPMTEADLRLHLAKQTAKRIGLIDIVKLDCGAGELADVKADVVLIDSLHERHLATVGRLISRSAFVVGSSGVESALMAYWGCEAKTFSAVRSAGPILAICGSCSPVSARQVDWALANGFADASDGIEAATRAIRGGRSAVIHTRSGRPGARFGEIALEIIETTKVRRVLVAGGDTSGEIARALDIESLEMIGELTRGSPLCRATAPGSPADGIEITFKGGQIGAEDFFGLVRDGSAQHA